MSGFLSRLCGDDMLQGLFIVAEVNIAGLNGALGELVVTGFGVMAL